MNTYLVQRGDTIAKVAMKFGVSEKDLIALNNIPAPYRLFERQSLRIPGMAGNAGMVNMAVGGILLYGIFRVLMKIF